eukprot:m.13251 g.13251  ORF g.13251 m.13251 type:complete len:502 (-) comp4820_c0_seq1:88-1593(-)
MSLQAPLIQDGEEEDVVEMNALDFQPDKQSLSSRTATYDSAAPNNYDPYTAALYDIVADAKQDGHKANEGMSWLDASFMITAIILGLGVLGLPQAVSRLGWLWGTLIVCVGASVAIYSGLLINKAVHTVTERFELRPTTYSMLVENALGPNTGIFCHVVQQTYLGGIIISCQLTAGYCLRQIFYYSGFEACIYIAHAIIAALMLPVMQIKSLREANIIAIIGVGAVIICLIMFMIELLKESHPKPRTSTDFPKGSSAMYAAQACSTILFAYQGQTIFPEIMSEMTNPEDFPKAVYSSIWFMTSVYLIVALLGYYAMGSDSTYLQTWADDVMGNSLVTTLANALLAIHVMVGYAINGNVFNKALFKALFARKDGAEVAADMVDSKPGNLPWFGVTCITVFGAYLFANLVGDLDGLISLIGAFCGTCLTILFPVAAVMHLQKKFLGPLEKVGHSIIFLAGLALLGFGSYSSCIEIYKDAKASGGPFSCVNITQTRVHHSYSNG